MRYKRLSFSAEERIMDVYKENNILAQKLDDATEKGREEGIQIGEEQGRKSEKIQVIKNSLKVSISVDVIAEITGLSLDEIKKLLGALNKLIYF